MIFLTEALLLCILFTVLVVPSVLSDPLQWVSDYPPKVVEKVKELGLIPKEKPVRTKKVWIRKSMAALLSALLLAAVVVFVNGAKNFSQVFLISYGLWLTVAWYDAFVLDILWACHDKRVRVKGTEHMDKEYKDYFFHIRMSMIGSLLGLPVCLVSALMGCLFLLL